MPRPALLAVLVLSLAALWTTACASATPKSTQLIERTQIDYDSTRDASGLPAKGLPGASDKCQHVWVAVTTHAYYDDAYDPPMPNLCTVTQCTKCGALHHECAERRHR